MMSLGQQSQSLSGRGHSHTIEGGSANYALIVVFFDFLLFVRVSSFALEDQVLDKLRLYFGSCLLLAIL